MTFLESILGSRASFELAAHLVTWAALVIVVIIAVSLHVRLTRLERLDQHRNQAAPFSHLLGKNVDDVLNGFVPRPRPRLMLFVSSSCPACETLLKELRERKRETPSMVAWTNETSEGIPELPGYATLVPDGPRVSAELGIRITPFVLVADEAGVITKASPVNSINSLFETIETGARASGAQQLDGALTDRKLR